MSNDVNEFKAVANQLLAQNALLLSKQTAILQMNLGVYRETLEKEAYNNIVERFIGIYEEFCTDALNNLEDVLFFTDDTSFILRQKTALLSNVEEMKQSFLS